MFISLNSYDTLKYSLIQLTHRSCHAFYISPIQLHALAEKKGKYFRDPTKKIRISIRIKSLIFLSRMSTFYPYISLKLTIFYIHTYIYICYAMFCFISIETVKFLSIKLLIAMLRIQKAENFDAKRLSNHTEIYGYEEFM